MKNTWKAALAAVAVLGSAQVAKADVSLSGPTGLFLNPTAEVAQKGTGEVSALYERDSFAGTHANTVGLSGVVGIADKAEVSLGYHHLSEKPLGIHVSENAWNIGAKYQLMNKSDKGLTVAIGADYQRAKVTISGVGSATVHQEDAYAVATKSFNTSSDRAPIQGSLGIRYSHYSMGSSKVNAFAGVAIPVTSTGDIKLIGELNSARADGSQSQYVLGVRYSPQRSDFNIGAGVHRHGFFAQVGYKFGK